MFINQLREKIGVMFGCFSYTTRVTLADGRVLAAPLVVGADGRGSRIRTLAGIDVTHVPYRGGGDATTAVMANQVTMVFTAVPVGLSHIQGGRLKGLAVTGTSRSSLAPQIPSMAEAGVAGYEFSVWNMVLVPARTPKNVIARLHEAITKSLQSASLRESYAKMGALPGGSATPEQARAYLVSEIERYAKLVKAIGLKIE